MTTDEAIAILNAEYNKMQLTVQMTMQDFYMATREAFIQAGQARAQGEPVAYRWKEFEGIGGSPLTKYSDAAPQAASCVEITPLYTAPPAQEEPTDEMIVAGGEELCENLGAMQLELSNRTAEAVYKAMIAARTK